MLTLRGTVRDKTSDLPAKPISVKVCHKVVPAKV
jgi:hypothetical protein